MLTACCCWLRDNEWSENGLKSRVIVPRMCCWISLLRPRCCRPTTRCRRQWKPNAWRPCEIRELLQQEYILLDLLAGIGSDVGLQHANDGQRWVIFGECFGFQILSSQYVLLNLVAEIGGAAGLLRNIDVQQWVMFGEWFDFENFPGAYIVPPFVRFIQCAKDSKPLSSPSSEASISFEKINASLSISSTADSSFSPPFRPEEAPDDLLWLLETSLSCLRALRSASSE